MPVTDETIVNAEAEIQADKMMLGGKGSSLFWMASQGLPVPPFFVLTTRAWRDWRSAGQLPQQQVVRVMEMISWLERSTGRTFGAGPKPLLVSVRSTGPVSMPGMPWPPTRPAAQGLAASSSSRMPQDSLGLLSWTNPDSAQDTHTMSPSELVMTCRVLLC